MDIAIYVADGASASGLSGLIDAVGELPEGYSLRVADLSGDDGRRVPAEVLRVLLRRRDEALPLVMVDGVPALSGRLPTPYEVLSLLPDDGTRPAVVTQAVSAVEFPTASRLHVSLNVGSLDVSVPFYEVLFGTAPVKVKPYYAKFELDDPPLNITLNERPFERAEKEGAVGHFGIQVKTSDAVMAAKARYGQAGFFVEEETQTACCFAVQTKVWVADPDLNKWEIFVVTEPEADAGCGPDCICLPCYKQMQASTARPAPEPATVGR